MVDPSNANHVFVAYSGYREGDLSANVWETINGGSSWTNISGKLPNAPVEMLAYDTTRGDLYAATDLGVFQDKNAMKNWCGWVAICGTRRCSMSRSPLTDAATFGRSVWVVPLR
ncbi:MAG: hypothetical protein QOF92_4665 [Pseudonocardiales bacterium]|nr:hypothetical protein [Pseudonocardiales bacterium]